MSKERKNVGCLGSLAVIFGGGCLVTMMVMFITAGTCASKLTSSPEQREARQKAQDQRRAEQAIRDAEEARRIEVEGRWSSHSWKDPMTDFDNFSMSLDADQRYDGWLGSKKVTLNLACRSNKTEFWINFNSSLDVERGNYQKSHIRLRVDEQKAFFVNGSESTDGDALFLPSAITRAKGLIGAKQLTVAFTPFNAVAQAVTFSMRGYKHHLEKLRERCGW